MILTPEYQRLQDVPVSENKNEEDQGDQEDNNSIQDFFWFHFYFILKFEQSRVGTRL